MLQNIAQPFLMTFCNFTFHLQCFRSPLSNDHSFLSKALSNAMMWFMLPVSSLESLYQIILSLVVSKDDKHASDMKTSLE